MAKSIYLDQQKVTQRYPLGHHFLEPSLIREGFERFLSQHRFSNNELDDLFNQLDGFQRGILTPQVLELRGSIRPGVFWDVYCQLVQLISEMLGMQQSNVTGSKEILCEEFLPFLTKQGAKTIIIVRDPRDVVASVNFSERDSMVGGHRPLLFTLRLWRKCIAYMIEMADNDNFFWLRYEDLVSEPMASLRRLTDFIEVAPYDAEIATEGIFDQTGQAWLGNSSFVQQHAISTSSVGVYRSKLPVDTLRYIESVVGPEMQWAGYTRDTPMTIDRRWLADYREPYSITHDKFSNTYSSCVEHVDEETKRLSCLRPEAKFGDENEIARWFIFPRVYERLRAAAANL